MKKGVLFALIILVLTFVVLLFQKGDVEVNLLFGKVNHLKSLVFLAFTCIGVTVGLLVK
jgi:uncharacterized integral membrane protein